MSTGNLRDDASSVGTESGKAANICRAQSEAATTEQRNGVRDGQQQHKQQQQQQQQLM